MKLDHLSWSQMNTLHNCGWQYYRRYQLGEIMPPGIAAVRGRSTHKANEENLRAKMNTGELRPVDEVRQFAADAFDRATTHGEYIINGEYSEMSVADALGTAKDEAISLAGLHAETVAPTIVPTGIEERIEIAASSALSTKFVSILDLIDGDQVIRDAKTARKTPARDVADRSDQLTSQHLAYWAKYKKAPQQLSLDYLIRTPKGSLKFERLETNRTRNDLQVFLSRAHAAIRMIEAEIYLPAPADSWICSERWCGYTENCPYFRGRPRPQS